MFTVAILILNLLCIFDKLGLLLEPVVLVESNSYSLESGVPQYP